MRIFVFVYFIDNRSIFSRELVARDDKSNAMILIGYLLVVCYYVSSLVNCPKTVKGDEVNTLKIKEPGGEMIAFRLFFGHVTSVHLSV